MDTATTTISDNDKQTIQGLVTAINAEISTIDHALAEYNAKASEALDECETKISELEAELDTEETALKEEIDQQQ